MTNRRLYPLDDAMDYLGGITKPTLYELINDHELDRVKIGRRSFVTKESLDEYIDRQVSAATEQPYPTIAAARAHPRTTKIAPSDTVEDWFESHWTQFKQADGVTTWALPGNWADTVLDLVNQGLPLPTLAYLVTTNLASYDDGLDAFAVIRSIAILIISDLEMVG